MSQNTTFDEATILEDGAAQKTATGVGQKDASASIINAGGGGLYSAPPKLGQAAVAEFNVTQRNGAGTLTLEVRGSTSANMASPVVLASVVVPVDTVGKYVLPVRNEVNGTRYQYLDCQHVIATGATVTYSASIGKV